MELNFFHIIRTISKTPQCWMAYSYWDIQYWILSSIFFLCYNKNACLTSCYCRDIFRLMGIVNSNYISRINFFIIFLLVRFSNSVWQYLTCLTGNLNWFGKFKLKRFMRNNIFVCLFSVHNIIVYHIKNKYVLWGYVLEDASPSIGQRRWLCHAYLQQICGPGRKQ